MPIHLVILLRSPEPKDMHLDQGQGQITLKTFGHSFANTFILAWTLDWTYAIIVKLRFHFDTISTRYPHISTKLHNNFL